MAGPRPTWLLGAWLLALPLGIAPSAPAAEVAVLVVVVHPARRDVLSVEELAQVYLRRKRFWSDGTPIAPLNLGPDDPLRARFVGLVLRRSPARLAEHWNRQYFDGVLPPATLGTPAAVLRFVAADRNAVGYLPAGAEDGSVRVVLTLPPSAAH